VVEQQEEIALGGISIRIHSAYVHDFDDHYFALTPFNNHRNPWFAEFWEQRFQCNLEYGSQQQQQQQQSQPSSSTTNRPAFIRPMNAKVYNRTCTGKESLRQNYKQDAKMAFVQKSIITMALGLDSMQRALCGPNRPGLCAEMLPVNGSIFLQHLMNVSFSFLDELVYFDEQGDPPGKYEILNFQRKRQPAAGYPGAGPQAGDSADTSGGWPDELAERHQHRPTAPSSYSTLKVFRSNGQAQQQRQLARRRARAPTWTSASAPPPTTTAAGQASYIYSGADYSATNSYEYVHVGSWKSSDGLSLFGEIQWPSRATAFNHYPGLSGTAPTAGHAQPGQQQQQHHLPQQQQAYPSAGPNASSTQASIEPYDLAGGLGGYLAPPAPADSQAGVNWPANRTVSSLRVQAPKSVCALPCTKGHAKVSQRPCSRQRGAASVARLRRATRPLAHD
jgi:hypothetical protein